ncbi:carboxypeptidase-like regulatory domain-containing protein [Flavisolibacter sp. BT320]|nr:carboxypeptidase-like regulatory domain-containing protein [Flavisolibacter longurius]
MAVPLLVCSCLAFAGFGATINGKITGEKGEPLSFASLTVKNTGKGVVANSEGFYSLNLDPGTYILVCQYVGHKTEERPVTIGAENRTENFSLLPQNLAMPEVVIKRGEDPAQKIMRQAIKKREENNRQIDSFTVDVYIKGLLRSREIPDRVLGQKIDKSQLQRNGIDSTGQGILFLSESVTKVAYKHPNKLKMEVVSSRQSGGGFGLSVPFFVNFYTNNVALFSGGISQRGFVSPLADGAFHFYTFRYEGNFFEEGRMINRIRVSPRRKNEPLFEGFVQIIDDEWRIHSLSLLVTKEYGLDLLDTVKVTQVHFPVAENAWRTQNQVVSVAAKMFGFSIGGDFLNVYSNYNLAPSFKRKFFDRVVMKYDTAFNKRDSLYWNSFRPVPLEKDEKQDFVLKDSLVKADREGMYSKFTIDSLRKAQKPVNPIKLIKGGVTRNFYSVDAYKTYRFEPLLKGLQYNTVEGVSLSAFQSFSISPKKGAWNYRTELNTRYGFSNSHLNAYASFQVQSKADSFHNRTIRFSGGKWVQQFNRSSPVDETTNSISTLLYRRNYLKLYEAWFGRVEYSKSFESGLNFSVNATYEDRIPLENRSDFSLFYKNRVLLPNHPFELAAIPFIPHAATVASAQVSFQPGQRYIEFPNRKVAIGSDYPVLQLQYSRGIPKLFNSTADFDKWKFTVSDDVNLKLAGTFRYRFSTGGFLNNRQVDIPDFQHFNGNQFLFTFDYLNTFQLAPYYRYSNTESFYTVLHAEHHLNGLLTNKIPLFNKLKWNLVAGTNTFYVNNNNYYVEAFAGLENIFKVFRVDVVTAVQAEPGHTVGVRIGFGGVIGNGIRRNR